MKRFILAALAIPLAWLGLAAVPVTAQNIYPYQAPRYGPGWQTPLSPYLNLLLPGNSAVNYFGLVQPQFQARQFYNQTTMSIQGLINQLPPPPGIVGEQDLDTPLRATGHPTAINYTGTYFSNLLGQPYSGVGAVQRGMGMGMMGAGGRPGMARGAGPMGASGMGTGGGGGVWPNMRPGMGPVGR
jgi:hypothetical protein